MSSNGGGGGNIDQIRVALQQLQAYELPAKYGEIADAENAHPNHQMMMSEQDTDLTEPLDGGTGGSGGGTPSSSKAARSAVPPGLDREAILRYKAARNTYLRQRTAQLFLEHLQTFDGENFTFPQQLLTEEAEADLRRREEQARSDLAAISRGAEEKLDRVRAKYRALVERREELARTVAEMEQSGDLAANDDVHDDDITEEMQMGGGGEGGAGDGLALGQLSQNSAATDANAHADADADIDDEQMAAQEERLASLIERKAELEARLRRLQTQRALVDADVVHNRRVVAELRGRNSSGGSSGNGAGHEMANDADAEVVDEEDMDDIEDPAAYIEQIEERTAATLRAAAEMRDAADWYDGMREALEELGGMRILGIEQVQDDAANTSTSANAASPSAIVVKFELLDEHHLEVQLSSEIVAGRRAAGRKSGGAGEVLRVASAKITTSTTVTSSRPAPSAADGSAAAGAGAVEVHIRQPTDLVELAANLAPVDDLRFVVRETQARIRAATLRSEELAVLRGSYLTRIGPAPRDAEEQEVVCSLSQGITVVLRLCGDCPLTEGSVYIGNIVGVGGWKQSDLDGVKRAVSKKAFASPVTLMDSLKQEIMRVTTHGMRGEEEDKTIELPKTPVLPTRR